MCTLHAGKALVFLKLDDDESGQCQARSPGKMAGHYFTDIGPLNQIEHLWGHDSLNDRCEHRKQLQAPPEWQSSAKKMRPRVANVENKILVPAPFSRCLKVQTGVTIVRR